MLIMSEIQWWCRGREDKLTGAEYVPALQVGVPKVLELKVLRYSEVFETRCMLRQLR